MDCFLSDKVQTMISRTTSQDESVKTDLYGFFCNSLSGMAKLQASSSKRASHLGHKKGALGVTDWIMLMTEDYVFFLNCYSHFCEITLLVKWMIPLHQRCACRKDSLNRRWVGF